MTTLGQLFISALREALADPDMRQEVKTLLGGVVEPKAFIERDGWLDTKGAAAYLGISPNALHKATAARTIKFEQDVPGGKCWFKREDLDAWRRSQRVVIGSPHGPTSAEEARRSTISKREPRLSELDFVQYDPEW